jgi:hypothetical protein
VLIKKGMTIRITNFIILETTAFTKVQCKIKVVILTLIAIWHRLAAGIDEIIMYHTCQLGH